MVGRSISLADGFILLTILVLTLIMTFLRVTRRGDLNLGEGEVRGELKKPILIFIVSAVGVAIGSRMLIYGGVRIAELLGIPEIVVGLTMIAVGTSLPELVTAVMSIRKKVVELSLGNIFGANILNLCWILGSCSLVRILPVDSQSIVFNLPVMLLIAVMLTIFTIVGSKITRIEGASLLAVYVFYTVALYTYMY
jgi:cation:H+ antiporter